MRYRPRANAILKGTGCLAGLVWLPILILAAGFRAAFDSFDDYENRRGFAREVVY